MAPTAAQKGDLIVILFGGQTPFLLRKLESEVDDYALIGECYVHGIMDGEATEWLHKGLHKSKSFTLC